MIVAPLFAGMRSFKPARSSIGLFLYTDRPSLSSVSFEMKRHLLVVLACAVSIFAIGTPARAEDTLGIGSPAPALDIEHYLSTGNGFFEPVTEFEDGKVYMIEFWATWCGPCIASMPHLVELQNQHRGEGFQIISVSDEDLETVKQLMEQTYPDTEKTFAELTSAYTLTVDPDGSVTEDYMRAAGRDGIPFAFLVGKTGLVEWIGHPMEADEPVAKVLDGTWDREAFKEQLRREEQIQIAMSKVNRLAGAGEFEDAIKVVDKTIDELDGAEDEAAEGLRERLVNLKYNLRLDAGDQSEEVLDYFRGQLESAKSDERELVQFAFGMMSSLQLGADIGPLADETIEALNQRVDQANEELQPLMHVLVSQLYSAMSELEKAIEAQKRAIEVSTGPQKERMEQLLEELQQMAEIESDPPEPDSGETAAAVPEAVGDGS